MSSDYQPLQGMHDITGDEVAHWQWLEQQARSLFYRFGYTELRTPILERQALFLHSLGDTTDIVQKEMYALEDRGGRSLALRPEGTAGVMRHLAGLGEEGQQMQCYYMGPMFRCERPQAGRKRQFHQIGVESAGEANPLADASVIVLQLELLKTWGLENITIRVGTRGAASDQEAIREGLRTAFSEKRDQFCEDCQRRIDENVLRVMDCKNEACQALLRSLPTPSDFLSAEAKAYHDAVLSALEELHIDVKSDPSLVRGLDYYEQTIWEIEHTALGAQSALASGGRYRIKLGKKELQGVGFAVGVERIAAVLDQQGWPATLTHSDKPIFWLVSLGEEALKEHMSLALTLRSAGYRVGMEVVVKSMKAQLRKAGRFKATHAVIRGEDELNKGTVVVKNLVESQQNELPFNEWLNNLEGA